MTPEELRGMPTRPSRPGILDLRPLLRLPLPAHTAMAALMQDIADSIADYSTQEKTRSTLARHRDGAGWE